MCDSLMKYFLRDHDKQATCISVEYNSLTLLLFTPARLQGLVHYYSSSHFMTSPYAKKVTNIFTTP